MEYAQENYAKSQVKQVELSAIHSELLDINESTSAIISEIRESLNKIHPYNEPSPIEKNPSGGIAKLEENSLVNSLKHQLRFSRENRDKLQMIVRHLSSLI